MEDESREIGTHSARSNKLLWLSLAVVGLVAAVGLVFVFRGTKDANPSEERADNKAISVVTPAPAASVQTNEAPKAVDPNARPTKIGEVVNGYVMLPSGRIHKRIGVVTNSVMQTRSPYSIFPHHCENEIANLIMAKPGQTVVGSPHYKGRFAKAFLKSLETPIIVTKDDSPEHAELKRAVNATKIELKAAYDRGEDIEQMMTDTRLQLQDMMKYRQELKSSYNKERFECKNAEDVEDLRKACNKMLESKGIAPIEFTPLTRQNLLINKEN